MASNFLPELEMRRVLVAGPLDPHPDAPRNTNGEAVVAYLVEAVAGPRKHPAEQTIRPATRRALAGEPAAHFEAWWQGHHWRIGDRVDHG